MGKAKEVEKTPPDAAPGEFGPIMADEYFALPEDVRRRRARRACEKFKALKGKVHLNIDIDELRGRNRVVDGGTKGAYDQLMSRTPPSEVEPTAPGSPVETELNPPEHLRKARGRRAYEKFLAIKGTIHLNIDIDELRGRNRR